MKHFRIGVAALALAALAVDAAHAAAGATPPQVEGLITKSSAYSVDVTIERLEAALKQRGFIIFARLDHAAAAAAVGLKMPRETVIVFGNPRLGTPNFLKYPTLAIDLPIKALVWQDSTGKVWLSYNTEHYLYKSVYARHGAPNDPKLIAQIEALFANVADSATR